MSSPLLHRARAGDDQAFGELTAPYVRELHVHCYRMLGSLTDADDLLQETLVAAWRGLDGFADRASIRAWLYRIATNRCLNAIRDATRRVRTTPVPPFQPPAPSRRSEMTWLQPYPDSGITQLTDAAPGPAARFETHEAVELAFIAALQQLPPRQTAVLVLGDVLGFSTTEVAGMLDCTATAVKGALQRARASMAQHRPGPAHQPSGGRGSAAEHDLARRFAASFTASDIDSVVALLTDDAWLAMPPAPHEYLGPSAIAAFLRASADWRDRHELMLVPTRANGQPALGCYLSHPDPQIPLPTGVLVLTMFRDRISRITRFLDADLPRHFELAAPSVSRSGSDR